MTRVVLGGGLGNQLFQYAAGIYVSKNFMLLLDNSYGHARTSSENAIDLDEFLLAENVTITNKIKTNLILRKFFNLSFRESSRSSLRVIQFLEFIWTSVNKILHRKNPKLFINSGLGLDSRIHTINPSSTLLGYFQCADIADDETVKSSLRKLRLKNRSLGLTKQIENATKINPIFVHVRLTDYKYEPKFGIPSSDYFERAIDTLDEGNNEIPQPIWLFSDAPKEAFQLIPSKFHSRIKLEPDLGLSPAETLELMRHGKGYVIANSSFSWWAAYLRYESKAPVFAPDPWFSGMEDPSGIYPSDWIRVSAGS